VNVNKTKYMDIYQDQDRERNSKCKVKSYFLLKFRHRPS